MKILFNNLFFLIMLKNENKNFKKLKKTIFNFLPNHFFTLNRVKLNKF